MLLGIDGGGTKTDGVICNEAGTVLKRAMGGPTNPSGLSKQDFEKNLRHLLYGLLQHHGGPENYTGACYAGISGCGLAANRNMLRGILESVLPHAKTLSCGSDTVNALNSGVGEGDGLVSIAGTGSCVFARTGGAWHQVGGWGYLLDDAGSGYDLGRMALNAALRALDGRGAATRLSALCQERMGAPIRDCIPRIYEGGRTFIASFAPLLIKAAQEQDPVALELFEKAARGLAEAIQTAAKHLSSPVKVVLAGSVWQQNGLMEQRVFSLLGEGFQLIRPALPPVYGAVLEAAYSAGIPISATFEEAFSNSLHNAG